MKNILKGMLVLLTTLLLSSSLYSQDFIGETKFKGETYYLHLIPKGKLVEVWLNKGKWRSSNEDIKVLEVRMKYGNSKKLADQFCKYNKKYSNAKAVIGCTNTLLSAGCIFVTPASGGLTAPVCTASWTYSATRGISDCIDPFVTSIAKKIGSYEEYKVLSASYNLSTGDVIDGLSDALELACYAIEQK